jgi:hypothetical protein
LISGVIGGIGKLKSNSLGIYIILVVAAAMSIDSANNWVIGYSISYLIDMLLIQNVIIVVKVIVFPWAKSSIKN